MCYMCASPTLKKRELKLETIYETSFSTSMSHYYNIDLVLTTAR